MMRRCVMLLAAAIATETASAQRISPVLAAQTSCVTTPAACAAPVTAATTRQPLQPGRVLGEVIIGAYAGVAGYLIGRTVGDGIAELIHGSDDEDHATARAIGGITGAAFGTAGGVYLIGNIGDHTGDFATTMLGTGAGWLVGSLAYRALAPDASDEGARSSRRRWAAATVEAILPSIGATIAFNSTRRYVK
ncbi:MAG: hypothetical protein K2X99_02765 [Gemmatimonadaceae bacterium]|nr:hypothetical protein [Gemmatimonadaceae bacterium]